MARVNVDTKAFVDPRIKLIANKISAGACSPLMHWHEVLGKMVCIWHHCTEFETEFMTASEIDLVADYPDFHSDLIESGLAEKIEGSPLIRVKGTSERIEWITNARKSGRKGGIKSGASRRRVASKETKQPSRVSGSNPQGSANPLAPAPAPAPAPALSNTPSEYSSSGDDDTPPLVQIWHEHKSSTQPEIKKLNPDRKRKIKARLKENPDLDQWREVVKRIAASDWCNGRTDRGNWIANFDFLLKPDTFHKTLEGQYDNRKQTQEQDRYERHLREEEELTRLYGPLSGGSGRVG